ncbi:hypothetical protein F2Q69_00012393 [Brassica cretica]|uniref:Replication factor A C-terminal domain-containing protein n=1 Tax=Brassica cretica TaxID=69181 RepID=A0A8S9R2J0_BRACR|nr:hypothetical protein F2Q69_00012393 [Brassica cretica]
MMVVASSTVWRVVAPATSSEDGGGGEEGGDGGEEVGSGGVGERSGDGGSGGSLHLVLLIPRLHKRFHSNNIIYRVEMSIADETGEALFVCFGGVMTKLHNMKTYGTGLLLGQPEETQAPPFVSDMVGFLNECDREPQPAFVDNGGDDDNGDDNPGAVSVPAKVEAGGSSQAEGASDMVKKARKA